MWTPFFLSVWSKLPLHALTSHHVINFHFLWCTILHHHNTTKGLLQIILHWVLPLACEGEMFTNTSMLSIRHQCIPYLNNTALAEAYCQSPAERHISFWAPNSRKLWARRAGSLGAFFGGEVFVGCPFKPHEILYFLSKLQNSCALLQNFSRASED